MGKKRRQNMEDNGTKLGGGFLAKTKEAIVDKMDEVNDANSYRNRQHWIGRWCQICGVENKEDIDYSNPYVNLEYQLCDFRIIGKLTAGKRDEVLETFTEQQR